MPGVPTGLIGVRQLGTHHDLAKFALGDITQLNFLHGYSLSGCPVERAWTHLGLERETTIVGLTATYGKPAQTRLFLANHRVATRTFQMGGIKNVISQSQRVADTYIIIEDLGIGCR